METHILKLPKRTGTCTVAEYTDRVEIKIHFDSYGSFNDLSELQRWLLPIFSKYDPDLRPVVMVNPITGERATVWGDQTSFIARIEAGNPNNPS